MNDIVYPELVLAIANEREHRFTFYPEAALRSGLSFMEVFGKLEVDPVAGYCAQIRLEVFPMEVAGLIANLESMAGVARSADTYVVKNITD